jgi:spore photoproduct lyase
MKIHNIPLQFGPNKTREIERLVFEIAKIYNIDPSSVLSNIKIKNYTSLKRFLLKKRYPQTFDKLPLSSFYLPKYEVDDTLKADISDKPFSPKRVYYTAQSAQTELFHNVKSLFGGAVFKEIESLDDLRPHSAGIKNFNCRLDNLALVHQKFDFIKNCPCTQGVINCGYSVMNLGMGCPYECVYCFLQSYQNIGAMVLPSNIDDFLSPEKIEPFRNKAGIFGRARLGSGEFCDSLAFDGITKYSHKIIKFFRQYPDMFFEFKTKSINISNLLESGGCENIVASWSVNACTMQEENEYKTASIVERLKAAEAVAAAGFSTAFHFDPLIFHDEWRKNYGLTVDMIFDMVDIKSIKWISLGTLRMPAVLKPVIENRFPNSTLLNAELILGDDYKLRYAKDIRIEMYKYMRQKIKAKSSCVKVYLCMESDDVWRASGGRG